MHLTPVVVMLIAISVVGAIAIPFGDPQFLDRATALEISYITLATVILFDGMLTVKGVPLARFALYACIPIAIIAVVGNSLASPHIEIMTTFSKPLNAILLIIGGYVLQAALIGTTIFHFARMHKVIVQRQKN
jgi:hypothetical protein